MEFLLMTSRPLVSFILGAAVRLWSTRTLHLASSDQAVRNFRSEAFAAPCQTAMGRAQASRRTWDICHTWSASAPCRHFGRPAWSVHSKSGCWM